MQYYKFYTSCNSFRHEYIVAAFYDTSRQEVEDLVQDFLADDADYYSILYPEDGAPQCDCGWESMMPEQAAEILGDDTVDDIPTEWLDDPQPYVVFEL